MIGRVFLGRYEVQRLIGEGGMGRVYLARQTDLGRMVVVKVMHDHVAQDARFRERFQRETLLMARFQHPRAVTLYDASLNDPSGSCIVMEYVRGVNLEILLTKNGRMTAPRVARIIQQLCEALQAAHDEGIIHRDLKPANLMIVDPDTPKERIKVMDFGLAKLVDDTTSQKVTDTNVDFAVGTPGYIAPEQVRGETMDHRGDLYSVGVMMYELLSGRLPFVGANSMDVLLAHATEPPPSFAEIGLTDWVPESVEEVVRKVLAKNPDDRPQTARELWEQLDAAIRSEVHKADQRVQAYSGASPYSQTAEQFATPEEEVIPLMSATPLPLGPAPGSNGLHSGSSLHFTMEAWMPEVIATRKLRGFVQDCSGEVIDSQPGLIRVKLNNTGSFNWFGIGRRTGATELELQLSRHDPRQENKLFINIWFFPPHSSLLNDKSWKEKCTKVYIELRAYLMGGG
ncbi:MAG: serine/threonine protein kinase [Fimbriiglobus sp.]